MFRNDRLTVKREVYDIREGGVTDERIETVVEDIPCHLSVNLTPVVKSYDVPCIISNFVLFAGSDTEIKPNDILIVTTEKGQKYELYAGEVKIYGLTTQVKCSLERVTEKDDI